MPERINQPSIKRTIRESRIFTFALILLIPVVKGLRIPVKSTASDEVMQLFEDNSDEASETRNQLIKLEEIIFRHIPGNFAENKDQINWRLGLATSIIFALTHQLEAKETDGNIKFTLTRNEIPLYQFISGIFLWYIARKRGNDHSVVAHQTIDETILTVGIVLDKILPNPNARR